MKDLQLKIITPQKIVREDVITSITVPSSEGEMTILPRHSNLFSQLYEGLLRYKKDDGSEEYLAIGGGYVETDGKHVTILVSRAYGQDQIDERMTQEAIEQAQKTINETKDTVTLKEANASLRRSFIDMKLVKHMKRKNIPQA